MDLLSIEHVSKQYTNHKALDDVSLTIPKGSIFGLLGPNGAGKTTLIRILTRITAPDTGHVLFNGHALSPEDIFRIGYLPEERGLYKKMKVGEQALFFARLKGISRHDALMRLKEWFERFGIEEWWNKKVDELSKGMAQKVQFITTVLHEPELLIFDEPFSGFDPINAKVLQDEILRLHKKGATIIFSTHNMASVEELCDHIALINKSHNILSGQTEEIRRRHGANIFEVQFRGDEERLTENLTRFGEILPSEEESFGELHTLKFHVERNEDLKTVIARTNDLVELRSFREIIPSMNDIFIRAVNGKL